MQSPGLTASAGSLQWLPSIVTPAQGACKGGPAIADSVSTGVQKITSIQVQPTPGFSMSPCQEQPESSTLSILPDQVPTSGTVTEALSVQGSFAQQSGQVPRAGGVGGTGCPTCGSSFLSRFLSLTEDNGTSAGIVSPLVRNLTERTK